MSFRSLYSLTTLILALMISALASCRNATATDDRIISQHKSAANIKLPPGCEGLEQERDCFHNNPEAAGYYFSGVEATNTFRVCPQRTSFSTYYASNARLKPDWQDVLLKLQNEGAEATVEEAYLFCIFRSNRTFTLEACAQMIGCHVDMETKDDCRERITQTVTFAKKLAKPHGGVYALNVPNADNDNKDKGIDLCSKVFPADSPDES